MPAASSVVVIRSQHISSLLVCGCHIDALRSDRSTEDGLRCNCFPDLLQCSNTDVPARFIRNRQLYPLYIKLLRIRITMNTGLLASSAAFDLSKFAPVGLPRSSAAFAIEFAFGTLFQAVADVPSATLACVVRQAASRAAAEGWLPLLLTASLALALPDSLCSS